MNMRTLLLSALVLAGIVGCDRGGDTEAQKPAVVEKPETGTVTNRIDLPETVRQNLGITFAKVERRRVAATLRVPGRFELLPSSRREYRVTAAGVVEILVKQYARVDTGTPLYRLRSPEWSKLRQQLQDDQSAAKQAAAEVAAAEAAQREAEQAVSILEKRVAALAEAGTRRAELESQVAERKASIPRLEAEVRAKRAAAEAAALRFPLTLASAASLLGVPEEKLTETVKPERGQGDALPRWRTVQAIDVSAAQPGVVESFGVTNGSWAEQAQLAVSTIDPQSLRFRASGLQTDLVKLRDGAPATIVPPQAAGSQAAEPLSGTLALGLEASADTRTIELIVTPEKLASWARAGVSAYAEVVTDSTTEVETAIPVAAVVQDELSRIFFRRDPKDPDKAIRVEGEFGVSDGKWIVVKSGVKAGDEVVMDGVFELKLAGGGKAGGAGGGGGHFHADGTWHPAGTPEPGGKK